MYFVNKSIAVILVLYVSINHIKCAGIGRTSINFKGNNKHDEKDRSRPTKHHDDQLPYKLENAPIPSVHDGPQVLRLRTWALVEGSRIKRQANQAKLLDRQKPKNEVAHEEASTNQSDDNQLESRHFHHPGHSSEPSRSIQPINNYNYYKVLNTYGGGFQYPNSQSYNGYFQTSNIGIVPPRGANARDYYNGISNINQYPMIGQHSLYESKKHQTYGYGYGYSDRDYVKNAYRNVLTGLAMWGIMNGLANGKRYTIYNYQTLPEYYPRNITVTNETITTCIEDATALCNDHSQPLCINNGTTFCVSSAIVPCPEEILQMGNTCVTISVPCDDCEDVQTTHLPCAANITLSNDVLDKQKFNATDSNAKDVVLCATTLVIPQIKNINQSVCDQPPCLEVGTETHLNSIVESTTSGHLGHEEWDK